MVTFLYIHQFLSHVLCFPVLIVSQDCKWISENNRCHNVRDNKHVGKEFCPKSCGYCDIWHEPWQPSPTRKPTPGSCHNSVDPNYYCYHDKEEQRRIKIHFTNCNPKPKDWIGIYDAHHGPLGDYREWWGNSYTWKNACGSRFCDYPTERGSVHFSGWWTDLKAGEYRAYLFHDNGYHVKASSSTFTIKNCGHRPPTTKPNAPTRKPNAPTRRPSTPTRKPIPYCHSSVEVEKYCYKDQYPQKIKIVLKNCQPQPKDWIGIYKVRHGYLGKTQDWWGSSFMWQFACGSKNCDSRNGDGTLYFEDWWSSLEDGQYKVYLFDNDSYEVKAASNTFRVGHCY